ncbi:MAG TPA: HAMP domain-containing sensor histidine kinase [Polyangiaceae bacterium]|nr:HAMP domain-containing sensor histidine kinase [Polyangiaceae bacterium]
MDARSSVPASSPSWPLASWMVLAIAVVTGLAWWDEQREADAALRDLETEQTVVAASFAATLRARLAGVECDARLHGVAATPAARDSSQIPIAVALPDGRRVDLALSPRALLGEESRAAQRDDPTVFLAAPNDPSFYAIDGRRLDSPPLFDALATGSPARRLSRPEAAQVGLPARTAMAGLARIDVGPMGRWGVAAVASAARERDREKRAEWRLVLGVVLASGLVLAFGGAALRRQRKELELSRELAIAERQRAEDEALARAQRVATMGTFAMGIAHEVATPLGVIVGRSEQLLNRVQGDERSERGARIILQQADRIQQIVRRFLDMARGGPPSLERVDPSAIARAAAASVEHRFAKAGVSLTTDVPPSMAEIQCDRALLEHAIVNLLLNACDACLQSKPAGEHVEVAVRSDAARVVFVVIDDGVGITPEHAARAAEPFFTTKAAGAGTGLGLAIATEIAKSHRGDLTITPRGGRGTRACMDIPVALPRKSS